LGVLHANANEENPSPDILNNFTMVERFEILSVFKERKTKASIGLDMLLLFYYHNRHI
jgi:hypothetical protein